MITRPSDIYTALLDTPTLWHHDVRALLIALADQTASWPEQTRSLLGGISNRGHIYVGRAGNGLIKIGFSKTPAERMLMQSLGPLLVILDCQLQHEQALHHIFRREIIRKREMFGGSGVEAFVAAARTASTHQLRNTPVGYACLILETSHTNPDAVAQLRADIKRVSEARATANRDRLFRRKSRHWFARQAARAA